ncbi:MAG: nicotinate-nicotinamide nucleotide adenylyltransferase [Phycisphaerales bacterium]|nr:MAG: nicotinate-nicotinamide nucleotide adenylyltransferase [Phycisphaerales bacterium]
MHAAPPVTPLTLPLDADDLILYGGTFDPPTRAHIDLPALARDAVLPGAVLVYIPAARSPHKPGGPDAPDDARVEMLKAAIDARTRTLIWTDEIDRAKASGEPSYMVDTLRRARQSLGGKPRMRLLIGADQALAFHRWKDHAEIAQLAEPLVMLRTPSESAEALLDQLAETGAWSDAELERWRARIAPVPTMGVSATDAREILKSRGTDSGALEALLPAPVLDIIRRRGLYGINS